MCFNKQKFYDNSIEIINNLNEHISYLGELQYQMMTLYAKKDNFFDEAEFIANSIIEESVKKLELAIISATEQLDLPVIRELFLTEFESFRGKESSIELLPWFDTSFSPVINLIKKYVFSIAIDVEQIKKKLDSNIPPKKDIDSIRTLLKNSGYLLNHLKITPKSEHEIHKPIFAYLKVLFPSAISKYKIHKPNKDYEIDVMIKKVNIGIEFKFAKSKNDVKKQMDELYTDMKGYIEDKTETKFIALMYMDSQYITEDVIVETLKQNKCPINWEIITVVNKIDK